MFEYYQRECIDGNFIHVVTVHPVTLADIKLEGKASIWMSTFNDDIWEDEFVLLKTLEHKYGEDSEEATLFVREIEDEMVFLDVVEGDPDEYWKKYLEE